MDGRELTLTNLDKVLYPRSGTTKGDCIDYYSKIAPVMLPHLDGRCITFKRFPDGVDRPGFFEKRCPRHRPSWVPTAQGAGDRSGGVDYCRIEEPAALMWAANLAVLEFHVPMARAADLDMPTTLVFDLDPGEAIHEHEVGGAAGPALAIAVEQCDQVAPIVELPDVGVGRGEAAAVVLVGVAARPGADEVDGIVVVGEGVHRRRRQAGRAQGRLAEGAITFEAVTEGRAADDAQALGAQAVLLAAERGGFGQDHAFVPGGRAPVLSAIPDRCTGVKANRESDGRGKRMDRVRACAFWAS